MVIAYALATTSFAGLCCLIWLLTGGTYLQAALVYFVSGQVMMVTMIGFAVITSQKNPEPEKQH